MKIVKELEEQYAYLWWWLLNQGLFLSTLIVNSIILIIFTFCMALLVVFLKWFTRH